MISVRNVLSKVVSPGTIGIALVCTCAVLGWQNCLFTARGASGGASTDLQADSFEPDSEQFYLAQVHDAEVQGPEIPTLVSYLHNLAGYYQRKGRYADSELVQRRVLAIWEKAPGHNERSILSCHMNLANLYSFQGDAAAPKKLCGKFKRRLHAGQSLPLKLALLKRKRTNIF